MKKTIICSYLLGLVALLSSCSNNSTASISGIHQSKNVAFASQQPVLMHQKANHGDAFKAYNHNGDIIVSSNTGFLPSAVSPEAKARATALPKDRHGSATYPMSERTRVVRTTAYSHMEMEPGAPGRKNAIGTTLAYGQVRSAAADWSVYPVGTRFKIHGLPYTYVVDDYGSALVGTNTVDIFHPSLDLMNRWGTREAKITVIQWGSMERASEILSKRLKYPHTRQMYYAAQSKMRSGSVVYNR